MTSIVFDKKDYTWRDKEYYKLYQRDLYVKRLGLKCMCQNCGSITTNKNLKTHQKTDKCKKYNLDNKETFKDRVDRIEEILLNLSSGLSKMD